ncbi:MAG: hypothetical protein IKA45_00600 [Bacteroidales bacterium]|nr:hypothetical protein [Bacteroidales bacterium]
MKIFQKLSTLAFAAMVITSCGNPAKMAEKAELISVNCDPQVLEVVADKVDAKVSVVIPADYFHPKAVVEVTPVMVYEGGETALEPVMLQGEDVTMNYTVVPEAGATVTKDLSFDYKPGMEKSHLELRMNIIYKDQTTPYPSPYKVADGANTTYKLVKRDGALAYAPDAYQAIIPETGEAQILYLINSSTVRPAQLKSDEIKAFQEFLKNVKADERREIVGTDIIAYASPDGKEDLNTKLSGKRAESATKAFNTKINNKKVGVETSINSVSISEDWDGFKDLVRNSDIADKDLILRVLEMYSDPIVREREIKNMSQVFTILAKEILPQLRRARFIANIEFTNYSDEELVALVNDNIEILDEEALLHAATLIKDNDTKVKVYSQAANKFNSDRANVNLAVTLLKQGKDAEASNALAKVSNKDAYYYNTLGVVALRKGDDAAAVAAFKQSSLKEAQYNLAVVDVVNGKYAEAKAKLAGEGCYNEALVNILTGDLAAANAIVKDAKCPCKSYLKAIVAARQGKVDDAKAALEVAKKDEKLAKRAEKDIEFAKVK